MLHALSMNKIIARTLLYQNSVDQIIPGFLKHEKLLLSMECE